MYNILYYGRCCPQKSQMRTLEEGRTRDSEDQRRSFENPVYTTEVKEAKNFQEDLRTQPETRKLNSQPSLDHDYINASKYRKIESDSEPEVDYENLKDKHFEPPQRKSIEQIEEVSQPKEKKKKKKKKKKHQTEDATNNEEEKYGIEDYDRPKPTVKPINTSDNDEELPDYDVPKKFTEDNNELPDYDVPKSFTG